jgi:ferrous iron transport protein A
MTSLDQIGVGEWVRIVRIPGDDAIVHRLLEMGLTDGEEVQLIARAPLGDPLEILVRDFRLSLRRSEAARVEVLPAADSDLSQ